MDVILDANVYLESDFLAEDANTSKRNSAEPEA